jgi:hypothetical protein
MFKLFLLLITLVSVLHNEVRNVGFKDICDYRYAKRSSLLYNAAKVQSKVISN